MAKAKQLIEQIDADIPNGDESEDHYDKYLKQYKALNEIKYAVRNLRLANSGVLKTAKALANIGYSSSSVKNLVDTQVLTTIEVLQKIARDVYNTIDNADSHNASFILSEIDQY